MTLPPPDLIGAITGAVFGYLLEHSGIGEAIRHKLGLDPTRKAFERALARALAEFEQQHHRWYLDLFDASFLQHEGAPVLAQLLLRDGHAGPSELAARWADSLNMRDGERRSHYTRELEPVALALLELLGRALKAEGDLRELHNDRALEQVSEAATALSALLGADRATPGTRRDYLRWLIGRNLYLDPRGSFQTQRQVQLRLDEVYIGLCAQPDERGDPADKAMQERELAALEEQIAGLPADEAEDQREHLRALLLKRARIQTPTAQTPTVQRQELAAVVAAHPRLVILGDPGGGKSTLLRFLALQHALALRDGRDEAGGGLGRARFPILLRIADYAEYGLARPLSEWLSDCCALHECPRAGLADLLAAELRRGGCLVLLDGLDEIVSPDDRQTVLGRIEEFVRRHNHGDNRFVVTSRPAGYRRAQLSGDLFEHYRVQEMDDEQIRRFLERWCRAVEDAQTPDVPPERRQEVARRELDGIMRAVATPGVRRLAANPLLLRILALIHRTGAQLPQKRIELYKLAADTLARTWRTAQGVPETALVQEQYLTPLLSRLAYWMQANKPTGLASEREVYAVLGGEWAEIHDEDWNRDRPNPRIDEQIASFLLRVREHTGLFVERAPRLYGFLHLTFQEYYAARYLVASSASRAQLIRQHLHDPRWDEPILLGLGFVGLDSPKEATELLETAVLAQGAEAQRLGLKPSRHEDLLGRDYLFALRCLADQIPIRNRLLRPLIERLAEETLHGSGLAVYMRYRELLWKRLEALSGEAAVQLAPLFIGGLRDSDRDMRVRVVEALGVLGYEAEEVVAALRAALEDSDRDVRRRAVEALRGLGVGEEDMMAALRAALEHGDPNVRRRAVEALGRLEGEIEGVAATLRVALEDSDQDVRNRVVESLRGLGDEAEEMAAVLRAALEDSDPDVRRQAVEALGRLEGKVEGVVAVLRAALHHSDRDVRVRAVQVLWGLGNEAKGVASALRAMLDHSESGVRRRAAEALEWLEGEIEEMVAVLRAALEHSDPNVRRSAIEALAWLGGKAEGDAVALRAALEDSDRDVRRSAVEALGRLGGEIEDVVAALGDSDQDVRISAVKTLGWFGGKAEGVVVALRAALGDSDPNVRRSVVEALEWLGGEAEGVLAALRAALEDSDPNVRRSAVEALGQLRGETKEVLAALRAALEDSDPNVRRSAIEALGWLGGEAEDVVALEDSDPDVHIDAVEALGWPGGEAEDVVALEDSDPGVHIDAVEALGWPGGEEEDVVALEDSDPDVHIDAVEVLGWPGGEAEEVAALEHSEADVRNTVVEALKGLEGVTDALLVQALDGLANATSWQIRQQHAAYLGRAAQAEEAVLDALQRGLLDRDNDVRRACATALAQLGWRFPDCVGQIEQLLLYAIYDPVFAVQDKVNYRTGHDYAQEGLWLLVTGKA